MLKPMDFKSELQQLADLKHAGELPTKFLHPDGTVMNRPCTGDQLRDLLIMSLQGSHNAKGWTNGDEALKHIKSAIMLLSE